jgi:hypothetical protein
VGGLREHPRPPLEGHEVTTDARLELLKDATAIEAAGGQWTALHVGAILGLARKTVYDTAWLRRIAKPAGNGTWRWDPAQVRRQQDVEAKRRPQRLRRKVS